MSDLPTPWDDLAHIFRAMSRGTKRSKLRSAAVVCPKGHTLVEIYRGSSRTLWGMFPTERPDSGRSKSQKGWNAVDLSNITHHMPGQTSLTSRTLWCRCSDSSFVVFVEPIRDAVEVGQHRIVLTQDSMITDHTLDKLTAAHKESGFSREFELGTPTHTIP